MTDVLRQLPDNSIREQLFPQAVLHASVEKLEATSGIRFSRFDDELDGYAAAFLRVETVPGRSEKPGDNRIRFLRFHGGPSPLTGDTDMDDPESSVMDTVSFMLHRYDREPEGTITLFLPAHLSGFKTTNPAVSRIMKILLLDDDTLCWTQDRS